MSTMLRTNSTMGQSEKGKENKRSWGAPVPETESATQRDPSKQHAGMIFNRPRVVVVQVKLRKENHCWMKGKE
jgi:hypothetical protein